MTSEVTQADSGMDGQSVERAELVWTNLPTNRPWASLPTYEKALVCHTLARLTAQSGEGCSFEEMKAEEARIMQDWRWGNLTRLGVANHLRRAGFDIRYATDKANALEGDGRSGAGEDALRDALELAKIKLRRYMDVHGPNGLNPDTYVGGYQAEIEAVLTTIDAALNARQSGEGERE